MSHLQGGKVDISLLHTQTLRDLINLIEKHQGPKLMVWEDSLPDPIGQIIGIKLKELDVTIAPLSTKQLPETNAKHVIFVSRPKLSAMDLISRTIHAYQKTRSGRNIQYHIIFVPKNSALCRKRVETGGVRGSIASIEVFPCVLFPFDSDLISMEISEVFSEYYVQNDLTSLYQIAQAIIRLQETYGPIPRVWGKGQAAKQVWDLVKRLQHENNLTETYKTHRTSAIDQILLIDRSIDLITPLATQLTYEGLIDEIFGIKSSTVRLPAERFISKEEQTSELREAKMKIVLNSAEKLFADLRDKNFNAVGPSLSREAKEISAQLEERKDQTVQEMKQFVQRLPSILAKKKGISTHTTIAECIKEVTDSFDFLDNLQAEQEFLNCIEVDKANQYIEDLIAQKAPFLKVIRLMCLQCMTSSGFKPKLLEYYKREIVQVYGIESLLALINLEKAGLLKPQSGSRQYMVLRKALRLTVEDTNEINPKDISYVHSVYAPLSVRIAEQLTKGGGWKQLQDVLGLLPGPTVDEIPVVCNPSTMPNGNGLDSPTVVLVFFIGGCTFAEISALRHISQQDDSNVEFVIATTKLINGNTFLQSIIDVNNKKSTVY